MKKKIITEVKKEAPKFFTAVSYSRYSTWLKCPLLAKYKYLLKLPEPSGPAADRGTAIHLAGEHYIKGKTPKLPSELTPFKKELDKIKKAKLFTAEEQWAFDINWQPVSWFDRNTYMRMILDTTSHGKDYVMLDDFKTGKVYPGHTEQMELYAAGGAAKFPRDLFPKIKKFVTRLLYIDKKQIVEEEFDRDAAEHQILEWDHKVRPMLADRRFPAKPGSACKWCHFRKSNNGPCRNG